MSKVRRVISGAEALQPSTNFIGRPLDIFNSDFKSMVTCFGQPVYVDDPNINFEWRFEFDGEFFYIYDWQQQIKNLGTWTIGGNTDPEKFKRWILKTLEEWQE